GIASAASSANKPRSTARSWRARWHGSCAPNPPTARGDELVEAASAVVARPHRRWTMKAGKLLQQAERLSRAYRIDDGKAFHLKDVDPADTHRLDSKKTAGEQLARGVEVLSEMQSMLYAQDRWAVLLIFQAMDAAGKDSTIKHVMSGVNPQGCQVYS